MLPSNVYRMIHETVYGDTKSSSGNKVRSIVSKSNSASYMRMAKFSKHLKSGNMDCTREFLFAKNY